VGLFHLGPTVDSALYQSVTRLRRAESKCIYLVDGNGRVIYHTNPGYIGDDFSDHPVVEKVLHETAGAYRTHDLDGQEIVASFAPVPGTSWGLVSEESWAGLTAHSRRFGHTLLVLLSLGILVPATIVTLGVRRITQPIADLIGAAQEIAGGGFGRRIESSSGDELEELAKQFNLMAAQLQESYAHLERKVADRTRELATLNAIAAEVSQTLDLEKILERALDEVLAVMEMESGQAFRLVPETEMLVSVVDRGLSDEYLQHTARLPLGASLPGQAAQAGKPAVHAVSAIPQGDFREMAEADGLQLAICVPLMVHGKSVGALSLGTRHPRVVAPEEMSLLAAIGHQIGVAVENAQLYEQAQQLAVMKERNRLARDLHDSVTQAMYGVTLYAEAAARQLLLGDRDLAAQHLSDIRETAQESLCEMRLLVFELRLPMLKQEGLASALQARLEAVESRVGLETQFEANVKGQLPAEIEEGLYRIAQEALNNALRHAHAQSVSVHLRQNGKSLTLEIIDDGVGFDPDSARHQGGFGLRSMEERTARLGGKLAVESGPGQGSRVSVEVRR
jgi:signal transduction histidine kinase